MLILGIDPGLESVGYGVVRKVGSKIEAVDYGLIKTPRILIPERLKLIHDGVVELIDKHGDGRREGVGDDFVGGGGYGN